ncbi:MAG TPA: 16S rRNA (guanine(527)-N(7))-methyltransferase RsmG [Terriglobia bacterium]|nr:16S rRNA (guanine(527)-N(7))-methyltransferase RsmG [Terriglobia bacterium]
MTKRNPSKAPQPTGGFKDREGTSSLDGLLRTAVSELDLSLTSRQFEQLATHFALLLRWNERINLTSIRNPAEIATRHFEESLFLAKILPPPDGPVVDIGSGAGFPGLPLKIAWPEVEVVLLEPSHKKAAFLKEVIRHCGLERVAVRAERLGSDAPAGLAGRAALVTMRAVAPAPALLQQMSQLLRAKGQMALFLGERDAAVVPQLAGMQWSLPLPIPHSLRRVILIGTALSPAGAQDCDG